MQNKTVKRQLGFSLVELMVTVAIAGILTAVALPSYTQHIQKNNRTEGRNMLLEVASKQQQYFSDNMAFSATMGALGYGAKNTNAFDTETGSYSLSAALIAGGFKITATAQNAQANDGCGNLTITNTGVKGMTSGTVSECWE